MTIHGALIFGNTHDEKWPGNVPDAKLPLVGDGFLWVDASTTSAEELSALLLAYAPPPTMKVELLAGPSIPRVVEQEDRLLLALPWPKLVSKMGAEGSVFLLERARIVSVAWDCRHGHRRSRDRIERLEPSAITPALVLDALLSPIIADYDDALGTLNDRVVAMGRSVLDRPRASLLSQEVVRLRDDVSLVHTALAHLVIFLQKLRSQGSPIAYGEDGIRSIADTIDPLLAQSNRLLEALDATERYREGRVAQDRCRKAWLTIGLTSSVLVLVLIRVTLPDHAGRSSTLVLAILLFAARVVLALCLASILFRYVSHRQSSRVATPRHDRTRF